MQTPHAASTPQSPLRTALAGLIGNTLEWFDFAVYGYFASDIGRQFFPQADDTAQLLLAFAVFALGFMARPLGGLVLGTVGDRIGRRALMMLSITLMGGATLAIGLLPGYATLGLAAPVLLVLLRLVQGFSLGGEFTGSMVYTTELAPRERRGLVSSFAAAGVTLGFILGSAAAWLVNRSLDDAQVSEWGWRIPFVGSVLLLGVGWALRRGLQETEQGKIAAGTRPPLLASLVADWQPMLRAFGIIAMTNAAYYLMFTYVVERRSKSAGAQTDAGADFLLANTLCLVVVLFAKLLGGWLSDRVGRRRLMLILTVTALAAIVPGLWLALNGEPWQFFLGQLLLAVPLGMALGLQGALLVEIFPLRTRVTSMSFAYGTTLALTGGTAPLVATWLVERTQVPLAPAFYVMAYGLVALLLVWPMTETNRRTLDQ
jgi:MHS family proline/betaine transporter-like MFS transporter